MICAAARGRWTASAAGRYCSTSATWSSRSTAATSPPRTSASAPADLVGDPRADPHVTGLPPDKGGSGDPSPFTAIGVEAAIRACVAARFGDGEPAGRTVARGRARPRRRAARAPARRRGRRLLVSDIDPAKRGARRAASAPAGSTPRGDAARCDVLAPCALGGAISATNVDRLRCEMVCGVGEQPARRRGARRPARRARDPVRARLHRQRRRADQRLPRDRRLRRCAGGEAGAGDRATTLDRGCSRPRRRGHHAAGRRPRARRRAARGAPVRN